jgi:hypothetical protein
LIIIFSICGFDLAFIFILLHWHFRCHIILDHLYCWFCCHKLFSSSLLLFLIDFSICHLLHLWCWSSPSFYLLHSRYLIIFLFFISSICDFDGISFLLVLHYRVCSSFFTFPFLFLIFRSLLHFHDWRFRFVFFFNLHR